MKLIEVQILLVEDSEAEARLAREALIEARVHHRLHVVPDGIEAINFLYRRTKYQDAPRPDIVLLDLNLPGKNGREVLHQLKQDENLRVIPVIVLTTSNAREDIIQAYELQANCYITKPMDMENFVRVVKSIHGFWLGMVTLPRV